MDKIMSALMSRTIMLAIVQAIVGVVILVLTEADMAGYAVMVKSVADIFLRVDTTRKI